MMIAKTRMGSREDSGPFSRFRRTLTEGIAVLALAAASGCATSESRRASPLESLSQQLMESQVIIATSEEDGSRLRATVLVFDGRDAGGTSSRDFVHELESGCERAEPENVYGCVCGRSAERSPELNLRALRSAVISFEYFETGESGSGGSWRAVPGCERVIADSSFADPEIQSSVEPEDLPHYGECDISAISGGRVYIRATLVPQEGQDVAASSAEFEFIRR